MKVKDKQKFYWCLNNIQKKKNFSYGKGERRSFINILEQICSVNLEVCTGLHFWTRARPVGFFYLPDHGDVKCQFSEISKNVEFD